MTLVPWQVPAPADLANGPEACLDPGIDPRAHSCSDGTIRESRLPPNEDRYGRVDLSPALLLSGRKRNRGKRQKRVRVVGSHLRRCHLQPRGNTLTARVFLLGARVSRKTGKQAVSLDGELDHVSEITANGECDVKKLLVVKRWGGHTRSGQRARRKPLRSGTNCQVLLPSSQVSRALFFSSCRPVQETSIQACLDVATGLFLA